MSATAEIIPFPARTAATTAAPSPARGTAPDPATPTPAEARLSRALADLNNAVTAQRAAMAIWKSSLGDLKHAMRRLNTGLRGYDDVLTRLDTRVVTLRGEAAKLERWADDSLRKGEG